MTTNTENKINTSKVKEIFFGLFRFEKSYFLTFIFIIHIIVQVLVLVWWLYKWATFGYWAQWILYFLWAILLYPLVFLAVRFWFEFLAILFSINDNVLEIKKHLKK